MTPLERFRYWIAKPLLDKLRDELVDLACQRQREAYQLGRTQGEAIGQLQGQQHLLGEMSRFMEERHSDLPEVTVADIERAKKGMVH